MNNTNPRISKEPNAYIKNSGDNLNGQNRAELALHHPLITQTVLLPTPPIKELFLVIRRIVVLRETGCCFAAASGVGKTSALDMVAALLKVQMPDLCIIKHDTHNQQFPSIRAFFKHFLSTIKHEEKKGETYDLRERVVNWLIDEARICGLNMVLLSIDEAHAMATQDFDFLKDVYNDLHREGVQLVTVLMGQDPDLLKVIERLKHSNRLDLIGRFAMRILPFRAYNSLNDLSMILTGIDEAVFPEKSHISWTEFYFPKAFKQGFRLQNEASAFWTAIKFVAPKREAPNFSFPARQTFVAIRTFMIDNACFDAEQMELPVNAWDKAVSYSTMGEAMVLMQAPRQPSKTRIIR
tara:strand:- start:47958 stop:49013 length:1056 start_codon:yes stop_codon:yes gene_type:complete